MDTDAPAAGSSTAGVGCVIAVEGGGHGAGSGGRAGAESANMEFATDSMNASGALIVSWEPPGGP